MLAQLGSVTSEPLLTKDGFLQPLCSGSPGTWNLLATLRTMLRPEALRSTGLFALRPLSPSGLTLVILMTLFQQESIIRSMGFNKIIQALALLQLPGDTAFFWEVNFLLFNPLYLKQVTHSVLLQAGYYYHKSFCPLFFHLH